MRLTRALVLLALLAACAAHAEAPQRVLIVRSLSRDFGPSHAMMPVFRSELARLAQRPYVTQEASLAAERGGSLDDERSLVEFLRERYRGGDPDLVVVIGAPALRFVEAQRARLFPDAPRLLIGEERVARQARLGPRDHAVVQRVSLPAIRDTILQVRPETRTLAVVVGSSVLEQFWLKEFQREFAPVGERVELLWLTNMPIAEVARRVAALPPRSAVLHFLFAVDGDGVPHATELALRQVSTASSAPVFVVFESQLGEGVVGGRVLDYRKVGVAAAEQAVSMLRGEARVGDGRRHIDTEINAFDARQLERWGIPESRLPPGSEVRYRPPSLWQEHRPLILGVAAVLLAQAALIAGLILQRSRRRRAERAAVDLSGRLLTAHEDERRRLARELHDDLTQRLARLAIDAGQLERAPGAAPAATAMREELVRLSEDVHSMSYRLHPSMLDDLGLAEALKAECDRVARRGALRVEVNADGVPEGLSLDASLCLFRVAQEAMSNAARHGDASAIIVRLAASGEGMQLAVSDNG
ncbi:MAG TPA: histidine kinase, partial [Burkholderiales bacterium]